MVCINQQAYLQGPHPMESLHGGLDEIAMESSDTFSGRAQELLKNALLIPNKGNTHRKHIEVVPKTGGYPQIIRVFLFF